MRRFALTLASFLALAGCGSNDSQPSEGTPFKQVQSALVPLGSCADAEATFRESALAYMNQRLDAALKSYLESGGAPCVYADAGAYNGAGGTSGGGEGASQVSGTNNQVVGVDEADFIKNDNEFIYAVANGSLHVIQAWPANQAHEIAKVPIEGTPNALFVENGRALVYSSLDNGYVPPQGNYAGSCTYGYDCDFTGDGRPALITVFDLTDKSAPVKVREIRASGSYVNSRRIGSAVHTIISSPAADFAGLTYTPPGLPGCGATGLSEAEIRDAFEDLRKANQQLIESTPIGNWLPSITDTRFENGQPVTSGNLMESCPNFYRAGLSDASTVLTVMSLSIDDTAAPTTTSVLSRPGAVYSSSGALYLAVPQTPNGYFGYYDGWTTDEFSTVHKFVLDGATPSYQASGVVKGRVLNQFAMDEKDGYLRIATTTGHVPSPTVHSTLSVLAPSGSELVKVGQVDDIAPTEDIRSVRFDGDHGFVVTFKKTDPLYVFDLKDPRAPKITGELKIPGFSTYMHMMDPTHLLTIGYNADDQGDFAFFSGVLIQVFDVTDPANPTQQYVHELGTRGTTSEALTNHLAFNYFDPLHLLALPMTICEGGSPGTYGTDMTFNGLMVFDVTLAGGIQEKGRVGHSNGTTETYDDGMCSHWWTNASTEVKRSIFMDNWVFSISDSRIKVNELSALGTDVVEVSLK